MDGRHPTDPSRLLVRRWFTRREGSATKRCGTEGATHTCVKREWGLMGSAELVLLMIVLLKELRFLSHPLENVYLKLKSIQGKLFKICAGLNKATIRTVVSWPSSEGYGHPTQNLKF